MLSPTAPASSSRSTSSAGVRAVARLHVGGHRHVGHGGADAAYAVEGVVERHVLVVALAARVGQRVAADAERGEAGVGDGPRGPGVPDVGQDQRGAGVVELEQGGGASGDVHDVEAATSVVTGIDAPGWAFSRCDDPRLSGDRRRPGRTGGVVLPAPARDRPRRARRQPAPRRRLAAPLGLAGHGRRARRRRPAGVDRARPARALAANVVVPDYFDDYERRHDLPVVRPGARRPGRERRRPPGRTRRRARVAHPHARQRQRHVDASVRALLPRHRVVRGGAGAHRALPRRRALPRPAGPRRRRRCLGRAVPRRARAGDRDPLGHPAAAGLARRSSTPPPAWPPSPRSRSAYAAGCRRRAWSA